MKRTAIGLMGAALALSACGGGSGSASMSATTATSTTTTTTMAAPATTTPARAPAAMPAGPAAAMPGQASAPPMPGGATVTEMAPVNGSGDVPRIQGSLADDTLRGDVLRTVLGSSSQIAPGCESAQAVQTLQIGGARVTQAPQGSGPWQEVWPVMLCGQLKLLQLDFTPSPQGGTDFHIRMVPGQAPG